MVSCWAEAVQIEAKRQGSGRTIGSILPVPITLRETTSSGTGVIQTEAQGCQSRQCRACLSAFQGPFSDFSLLARVVDAAVQYR